MKRRILRLGPGAASLILAIVVVCMSILSWMALISAKNDHKLTSRAIAFSVADYEKSAAAEQNFARLDALAAECAAQADNQEAYLDAIGAAVPPDMTADGDMISWSHESELGRKLQCVVRVLPLGSETRLEWRMHMFVSEAEPAAEIISLESVE